MSTFNTSLYFLFVFIGMIYTFKKVGITKVSILMILVFWEGLFDYINSILGMGIFNMYQIGLVFYGIYLLLSKRNNYVSTKNELVINITFILFSISFWISYYFNGGELFTIFSQYLFKFSLLWITYHCLKDIVFNKSKREYVKKVLLILILVQIAIAIIKIIIMGFEFEGLVGTVSYGGGGPAVVIPIGALIFYWVTKNGNFTKKDWIFVGSILIIAIASSKRQPILFFPIILFSLFVFVSKSTSFISLLKYLPLALIVFYIGVRTNSLFTPEGKVGGSFDISYVSKQISKYYFGDNDAVEVLSGNVEGFGRGAGLVLYSNPQRLTLLSLTEVLFGKGLYDVVTKKYGRLTAGSTRSEYGIQHDGLIGEAAALLYSIGYLGTIFMMLLVTAIIFSVKNKRLAWMLYLYFLWDILFYYNQFLFFNSSGMIILIIIFYYNGQENEKLLNLKRSKI